MIKKKLIPLPSIKIQQKVAFHLNKQFKHLTSLKKNIEKQKINIENLKKALLNEIFDIANEKD
jgi:restriction endonuclease S subunit